MNNWLAQIQYIIQENISVMNFGCLSAIMVDISCSWIQAPSYSFWKLVSVSTHHLVLRQGSIGVHTESLHRCMSATRRLISVRRTSKKKGMLSASCSGSKSAFEGLTAVMTSIFKASPVCNHQFQAACRNSTVSHHEIVYFDF